ncbi:hypothetical protein BDQ12DRAFT_615411 [Crucibulum laeve]|uniref:Transmembrane protein n=1 Tax=Crucibulum laeve TaxID=68775 RepID=A0A5C3LJR3_9AGAR|nr:hypothetical protein BDQ12DRAFT_615411 [Crucibulum laeve]
MPLRLNYPLTRPFQWRWFAPLALISAAVVVILLVVLNVALTGYETRTVFNNNFNISQSHWYDGFMPNSGSLCDPHLMGVGDVFTTNYTIFEWSIDSIVKANAGESGISYSGTALDDCDLSTLYVDGSLGASTINVTPIVTCSSNSTKVDSAFAVKARTTFSITSLPGIHSRLPGAVRYAYYDPSINPRTAVVDALAQNAGNDISQRLVDALIFSNDSTPVGLSLRIEFLPCPASLGNASCAINKPAYNISLSASQYANGMVFQNSLSDPISMNNPQIIDNVTSDALANLIQTIYASVRLDLGNPSPNNFIVHPEVTSKTLVETFPLTRNTPTPFVSGLYQFWTQPSEEFSKFLPVKMGGPANVQVVYLCRFQQQKPIGQLLVSVLVATLSMFSSAWAAFMLVATAIAKRRDDNGAFNVLCSIES